MSRLNNLWDSYLVDVDNRQFVDCKLFDDIAGKDIRNKSRRFQTIINEMLAGLDINAADVIHVEQVGKKRVTIAVKIAQLLCLRGFKEIPWNEARR